MKPKNKQMASLQSTILQLLPNQPYSVAEGHLATILEVDHDSIFGRLVAKVLRLVVKCLAGNCRNGRWRGHLPIVSCRDIVVIDVNARVHLPTFGPFVGAVEKKVTNLREILKNFFQ